MTEKENALRVITRSGEPGWVPISSKCIHSMVPSAINERPKGADGEDWFGCEWMFDSATQGYAQRFGNGPLLKDVTRWREDVRFPDLDAIDWEDCAKRDLEGVDRTEKILEIFWESGPFERSHHLLGFEEAFISMYDEPDAYKDFLAALTDWKMDAMGRLIDAYKPDLIYTHDDLGSASAPLLAPAMYREFIKPSHMRLGHFVRSKEVLLTQHSCGKIQDFIGDMIECGAQVIDTLQGGINDQEAVEAEYGSKVVFHGTLKPLIFDPMSTEAQLREEVRRSIDLFAPHKNLILNTASFHPGFTEILTDEAEKYGQDYWRRNCVIL